MKSFPTIKPIDKKMFKIELNDPYFQPILIETEEQFKEFIQKLLLNKKYEEAKDLTQQWINLKKEHFKLNYHGKFLNLGTKTAVMGIVNVTPDSFSDGNEDYKNINKILKKVEQMLENGADIIDVGGESTRPGSTPVSVEEELDRVIPIIKAIRKNFGDRFLLSIDTYKSSVADVAVSEGADIVNDISGMTFDEDMAKIVAKHDCHIVVNHIKGTPQTWKSMEIYYDDVVYEIIEFFKNQISYGISVGIKPDRFILDPGIGFGKKVEHNVEIIKRLEEFKILGLPLMIGISRKSFLNTILKNLLNRSDILPKERLSATLGATAYAVLKGAHIVRVHDVKETTEFLTILDVIRGYKVG